MDERRARVDGIEMRWIEEGEGPAVVCVHGIPTSPELWRYVIPRIRDARALAWEMVGYGEGMSEGKGRDISVAAQAGHLARWLDDLEIRPAVLVGHDLGGGVVQILAVRRPELVAGLVLTNAIGYDSWPIPAVKALRAMGGLLRHMPSPWLAWTLRSFMVLGHEDRGLASESGDIHLSRYARKGGSEAFVRQIRALDVRDTLAIQDELKRLELPAAVVWGAADGFQKIGYGERFARDLRAPLHRIPGGRHFTPEDHPEEVAAAIEEVMARAG
ncbi:MAG: alpha/beta fold hydrolase [Gemmatimonadetes bacterium]|nr:alpha/beta fold hydrolase [Gemmatimonadota bacterium]